MRTWMKEHGQQDKPLVLTEFGLLYPYQIVNDNCTIQDEYGRCFTPQRSADFMVKAYEYLEDAKDPDLGYALDNNRLVQQWMWFSMPWPAPEAVWNPSLLATVGLSELTIVGQTHINEINKRPLELNLLFKPGNAGSVQAARVGQPATLSIKVYNNGNTTVNDPVQVTFYADAGRTQPIGTATVPAGVRGCARRAYRVSVVWNESLAPGTYPYWVSVDPDNSIPESSNLDNYGWNFGGIGRTTLSAQHGKLIGSITLQFRPFVLLFVCNLGMTGFDGAGGSLVAGRRVSTTLKRRKTL